MQLKLTDEDSAVNSEPASFHTAIGSRHDKDVPLNQVATLRSSAHAQSLSSSNFSDKDKANIVTKMKKAGSSVETQV